MAYMRCMSSGQGRGLFIRIVAGPIVKSLKNPMTILNRALLSIILTVAHMVYTWAFKRCLCHYASLHVCTRGVPGPFGNLMKTLGFYGLNIREYGCFCKLGVAFVGVLIMRALPCWGLS